MKVETAVALVRRHGPLRLARLMRQLAREHGAQSTLRLVVARLAGSGKAHGFSIGPVADLADTQRVPVRSTVLRGGRIVIVGSLDLLQCKKYRVVQKQEMLESIVGAHVPVSEYRDMHRWRTLLQTADRVVLYRVPAGMEFDRLRAEAERLDIDLCYDIDDPVFDPETVRANPNLPYLSKSIQRSLLNDAELFFEAMRQCRRITVSTEGLRDLVRLRFPQAQCHVVPNGLDAETRHFGRVGQREKAGAGKPFSILLPSGSLAHAADTEVAIEGLLLFLKQRPDTDVITIGHFDPNSPLQAVARVRKLPYLSYSEYMRVLGESDASLVPLVDCPFNHCKSIVRLIDASAAGTPVIASPVGEYADPALAGSYLQARSPQDWCDGLVALAASADRGRALVETARRAVLERRDLNSLYGQLDAPLRSFLAGRAQQVREDERA